MERQFSPQNLIPQLTRQALRFRLFCPKTGDTLHTISNPDGSVSPEDAQMVQWAIRSYMDRVVEPNYTHTTDADFAVDFAQYLFVFIGDEVDAFPGEWYGYSPRLRQSGFPDGGWTRSQLPGVDWFESEIGRTHGQRSLGSNHLDG